MYEDVKTLTVNFVCSERPPNQSTSWFQQVLYEGLCDCKCEARLLPFYWCASPNQNGTNILDGLVQNEEAVSKCLWRQSHWGPWPATGSQLSHCGGLLSARSSKSMTGNIDGARLVVSFAFYFLQPLGVVVRERLDRTCWNPLRYLASWALRAKASEAWSWRKQLSQGGAKLGTVSRMFWEPACFDILGSFVLFCFWFLFLVFGSLWFCAPQKRLNMWNERRHPFAFHYLWHVDT